MGTENGNNSIRPLLDHYGRVHTNLRISVTDRCNIRCFYCMPNENVQFLPRADILSFEEIERLVHVMAGLGVNKLRLTGGEPLVRQNLDALVARIVRVSGIRDVALTTNGILLAEQAPALKAAGLHRLNISLDTLREETFERISRRSGLDRVLDGIRAAIGAGFQRIRLNAVAIRGITEEEIVPLVRFALDHGCEMRFIEFMPLDAEEHWQPEQVLSGEEIRTQIEREIGPLEPIFGGDPSQPAVDYRFGDGRGSVGFINPVSQPFCGDCNRLRVTAEGKLRNCLFSIEEWDARELLRSGADDAALADLIRACVAKKKPGHGIDSPDFLRPARDVSNRGMTPQDVQPRGIVKQSLPVNKGDRAFEGRFGWHGA